MIPEFIFKPTSVAAMLVFAGLIATLVGLGGRVEWKAFSISVAGLARALALVIGLAWIFGGAYFLFIKKAETESPPTAHVTITIEAVIYGKPQPGLITVPPFPGNTISCTQPARSVCDGKSECTIQFTNKLCGNDDPWESHLKTAEVIYRCGVDNSRRIWGIEGRDVNVRCGSQARSGTSAPIAKSGQASLHSWQIALDSMNCQFRRSFSAPE